MKSDDVIIIFYMGIGFGVGLSLAVGALVMSLWG